MRVCLRGFCPNGENKCCIECDDVNACEKLGKCSLDDYNLNLKDCSKESFLAIARKNREKNREFFNAWGNE